MKTIRAIEIEKQIKALEGEKAYITSMIALLMSEANMIDIEIEGFTRSGLNIETQLKDLRAELKDSL